MSQPMHAKHTSTMMALIAFRPGIMSGLPEILADSLRNATMEPVNVTAPMKMASPTSPR